MDQPKQAANWETIMTTHLLFLYQNPEKQRGSACNNILEIYKPMKEVSPPYRMLLASTGKGVRPLEGRVRV